MSLTAERLRELLHYDPETGVFTSLTSCKSVGWLDGRGYMWVTIDRKAYSAHRLAFLYMTGRWPKNTVDHINGVRNDNRWRNLDDVTVQENLSRYWSARSPKAAVSDRVRKVRLSINERDVLWNQYFKTTQADAMGRK